MNAHLETPLVAQCLTVSDSADGVTDGVITAAIEPLLATENGFSSHLGTVSTHEVLVNLTGSTNNLLALQRAKDIALAVRGITNTVAVRSDEVDDAKLQRDVARALADDPATNGYRVQCTAVGGVVTATGLVQSWTKKHPFQHVLQGVRGVHAFVADSLTIRGGAILNSDEEITTQVRELLDWDIRVNGALVDVRTEGQVVHLSGTVGTASEKARFVAIAYQTGATRVDACDVLVAYWALGRAIRREKVAPTTDEVIDRAVRDTLRFNPRIRASETLVQVHGGVVTLAGMVHNLRIKHDAEQDVRHVVGVTNVHNLLKVRPELPVPDEDICPTMATALAHDP